MIGLLSNHMHEKYAHVLHSFSAWSISTHQLDISCFHYMEGESPRQVYKERSASLRLSPSSVLSELQTASLLSPGEWEKMSSGSTRKMKNPEFIIVKNVCYDKRIQDDHRVLCQFRVKAWRIVFENQQYTVKKNKQKKRLLLIRRHCLTKLPLELLKKVNTTL